MVQLIKVADLAALDDPTAESLARTTTSGFYGALLDILTGLLGDAITDEPSLQAAIESAAVAAMDDASVQAQLAWSKTTLTASTDLNTMTTPGQYGAAAIPTNATAQNYPTTDRGMLIVGKQGTTVFYQLWVTFSQATPRVFVRVYGGATWGPWIELTNQIFKPVLAGSADLNTVTINGEYPANAVVTNWETQNYPANVRGHLSVRQAGTWVWQTFRSNDLASPREWLRVFNTAWSGWVLLTPSTTASAGIGYGSIQHDMLVDDLIAANGGPVGTGGAVPLALTFDDYPRDFRDYMRDELVARGVPYTLALSSRMYDAAAVGTGGTWEAVYNGAAGTSWSEIAGWLDADGGEAANHGATHQGGSGVAFHKAEIEQGRKDLEAALGRQIWGWIQPSATYVDGDGNPVTFSNGASVEAYAKTIAGKVIWDNHAIITGVRSIAGKVTVPRLGRPVQGLNRMWISSTAGIAGVQTAITNAYGTKHGLIVGSHGKDIPDGLITQAQFDAFLDWLVVERDAGRVMPMLLSEWAIADTRIPAA